MTMQKNKLGLMIAFTCLLVFGSLGLFFLFAFGQFAHYISIPTPYSTTTGTVSRYEYIGSGDKYKSGRFVCWVLYKVNGEPHLNQVAGCPVFSSVGDEVTVYYNPKNPVDSHVDTRRFSNICGIFGAVLLIIAVWLFIKIRREIKKPEDISLAEDIESPLSILNK